MAVYSFLPVALQMIRVHHKLACYAIGDTPCFRRRPLFNHGYYGIRVEEDESYRCIHGGRNHQDWELLITHS